MDLREAKERINEIDPLLEGNDVVEFARFDRDGCVVRVALTPRFRRIARKHRVWKSKGMLTALKNAQYGFSEGRSRSRGGADGIFLLDREFAPPNEMMRRMFNGFLDKPAPEVAQIAAFLRVAPSDLRAIRVVSHHARLLGVLARAGGEDWVVLVDVDPEKRAA